MKPASLTLVAFMLAGCASGPEFEETPPPPPRDCEQFSGSVGTPTWQDNTDFRIIAGRLANRLAGANNKLRAGAKCQRDVREANTKK